MRGTTPRCGCWAGKSSVQAATREPRSPRGLTNAVGHSSIRLALLLLLLLWFPLAAGCAPKVAIEAPKEPIVINMNIKVEHEIRVNVDQDLDQLFDEEEELF